MNNTISLDDAIRAIVKEENSLLFKKLEAVLLKTENGEHNQKPLNFIETQKYLSCSKSYLYKLTSNNRIPHSKRGKKLYFDKKALDRWLLSNKVKSVSEIQNEAEIYLNSKSTNRKF